MKWYGGLRARPSLSAAPVRKSVIMTSLHLHIARSIFVFYRLFISVFAAFFSGVSASSHDTGTSSSTGLYRIFFSVIVFSSGVSAASQDTPNADRPNILFIPVDDLNKWVGYMSRHTNRGNPQSLTPNIDRLSAMGTSFTNAHASSTICNPSRTAYWSGVRPSTSGCYDNKDFPWTSYIKEGLGINAHFKNNGYYVAGTGKTYHSSAQSPWKPIRLLYEEEWDEYPRSVWGWDTPPTAKAGFTEEVIEPENIRDTDDPDWRTTDYCIDQLLNDTVRDMRGDKPFFLACGLAKPHLPWAVNIAYYDLYPRDEVLLPPYTTNDWKEWNDAIMEDLEDVPEYAIDKFSRIDKEYTDIINLDRWEDSIQSYLATINYMDMNLGRLLDAYEEFSERDNTIIILFSDHGYHLGEKGHHKKQTLWENASDVPFIWVVPGLTTPDTICDRPVDLQSLYPTLCDLAGLAVPDHVDGDNIRPLLENPQAEWNGVAKLTMKYGNHAVVDERFRYIRYADGSEELYDHDNDPHEYVNLASDKRYDDIKAKLSKLLPKTDMAPWHDGSMQHNVTLTCNDKSVTVRKCTDGSFVARNPNNGCKFMSCPDCDTGNCFVPLSTPSPSSSPTYHPTEEPTSSPVSVEPTAAPVAIPTTPMVVDESTATDSEADPEICASDGEKAFDCGAGEMGGRAQYCCDGLICGGHKRCRAETGNAIAADTDAKDTEDPSSSGTVPFLSSTLAMFSLMAILVI